MDTAQQLAGAGSHAVHINITRTYECQWVKAILSEELCNRSLKTQKNVQTGPLLFQNLNDHSTNDPRAG